MPRDRSTIREYPEMISESDDPSCRPTSASTQLKHFSYPLCMISTGSSGLLLASSTRASDPCALDLFQALLAHPLGPSSARPASILLPISSSDDKVAGLALSA